MPVHDWTRVTAGAFHSFHSAWIVHLSEALNTGLLPNGYYALAEQHVGLVMPHILTLQQDKSESMPADEQGSVALLAAPPKVGKKLVATEANVARVRRRTLTIRHTSRHRVVAMVEIASLANKDREQSVEEFVSKVVAAVDHGIHVLLVDLFPPGPFDPLGLHGGIWGYFGDVQPPPPDQPVTLASYDAIRGLPEAIEEHVCIGKSLPNMPLYLIDASYIEAPLETTYQQAFRGMPGYYRDLLTKPPA